MVFIFTLKASTTHDAIPGMPEFIAEAMRRQRVEIESDLAGVSFCWERIGGKGFGVVSNCEVVVEFKSVPEVVSVSGSDA
jgi:hypothetical protein